MPGQETQVPSHTAGLPLLNYLNLHNNYTRERNNTHQDLFPYLLKGLRSDFESATVRARNLPLKTPGKPGTHRRGQALRRQPISVKARGCYQSQLCHPGHKQHHLRCSSFGQYRTHRVLGLFLYPGSRNPSILSQPHCQHLFFHTLLLKFSYFSSFLRAFGGGRE